MKSQLNNKKTMTKEEKEQWDALYQYVKKEILQYDDNQNIPSAIVLSLKGLKTGKVIENRSHEDKANYTYDIILTTFKICKSKILSAIHGKDFKSEISRFAYIRKIVENEINDVYLRMQNVERSKESIENLTLDNLSYVGAEYTPKSKNNKNPALQDLW